MSAWMLSKEHIDVLVTAARAFGLIEEGEEDQLGKDLWAENAASYNYRYSDRYASECPDPSTYSWEPRPVEVMGYIAKAAACYRYQACEHPEWPDSLAFRVSYRIEELATVRMDYGPTDEYGGWPVETNDAGELLLTQRSVLAYWDYCREQRAKGLEWDDRAGVWVSAPEGSRA